MKIGIFGDSFACHKLNPTPTWTEILSRKYNITNYALQGSNLHYSIDEIKKHHENYDKIVLVVTDPGRLELVNLTDVEGKSSKTFLTGLYDYKLINDVPSLQEKHIKEAARQYFIHLQNQDFDRYVHNLMLDEIKKIRPEIILIPAFRSSWNGLIEPSMFAIFDKENTAWNFDSTVIATKYYDNRNCHMTAENNAIFADKVDSWINGQPVHINLDDFVTTTNKDFYLKEL